MSTTNLNVWPRYADATEEVCSIAWEAILPPRLIPAFVKNEAIFWTLSYFIFFATWMLLLFNFLSAMAACYKTRVIWQARRITDNFFAFVVIYVLSFNDGSENISNQIQILMRTSWIIASIEFSLILLS